VLGVDAGEDVADFFARLNIRLGLPSGLRALGVPGSVIAVMAERAAATPTNPRPIDASGYREIFNAASTG